MKKCTLTLALVLCLVLCAFAFASCDKKGKTASTTAAAGKTECAHVWGDYVVDLEPTCSDAGVKSKYCTKCGAQDPASVAEIDPLPHTEAENYTVDTPATCSAVGWESKHCTVCGAIIASTAREIDIDENAHDVETWTVTDQATMFNQTGHRNGICKLCKKPVEEEIKYEPTVLICNGSKTGKYEYAQVSFKDVRGDKHFYPTDGDAYGNDLYVEYSVLWNPSMLNLDGANNSKNPYIVTRLKDTDPILYWSPTTKIRTSDCKDFPGAFEWMGRYRVPITDGEVITPTGMAPTYTDAANGKYTLGDQYSDFPNIGGNAAQPDVNNLDNGHEWGWHRIALRYHLELADEAAVKAGTAGDKTADYVGTVTVYIDGVAKFKLKTADFVVEDEQPGIRTLTGSLFTAEADGEGGITYKDMDENWVDPFELAQRSVKSGTTAYVVIADVMVTCGKDFAMKVDRVDNPEAAKFVVDETNNVEIDAPVYFKLHN